MGWTTGGSGSQVPGYGGGVRPHASPTAFHDRESFVAATVAAFGGDANSAPASLAASAGCQRTEQSAGGGGGPLRGGRAAGAPELGSSATAISPTYESDHALRYLDEEGRVDPMASALVSRRKRIRFEVDQAQERAKALGYRACVFVTLTAASDDPLPAGAISAYLDKLSKWLKRRSIQPVIVWVAEPQFRNDCRIHYHVLVWVPRRHQKWHIPKPDAGMWRHGSSEVAWARHPAAYLAKYMGKPGRGATRDQRTRSFRLAMFKWRRFREKYPPHVRTFGSVGLTRECRARIAYRRLPDYVRSVHPEGTVERARRGGGYVVEGTRRLCSAFVVSWLPGFGKVMGMSNHWQRDSAGSPQPLPSAYRRQ